VQWLFRGLQGRRALRRRSGRTTSFVEKFKEWAIGVFLSEREGRRVQPCALERDVKNRKIIVTDPRSLDRLDCPAAVGPMMAGTIFLDHGVLSILQIAIEQASERHLTDFKLCFRVWWLPNRNPAAKLNNCRSGIFEMVRKR